jgi:O-antigen/teichoic acid export membrane protein
MENLEIEKIKSKTTISVLFLSLRNMAIQFIGTIGFFLLTLKLGIGEVGLFAIVSESISILGYFSDIGLASALIQQKEEVSRGELRSTFTIQQLLVTFGLIIIAFIYPRIALSRGYGWEELSIVVSLCFAFMAASLKTIPSVLLERKLDFKQISLVDLIENLLYYIIAVTFAYLGFGIFSYSIATFIKSIVGLVIMYRLSPWNFGFSFDFSSTNKLLRFGIPYQLNSFIALAKDRLSDLLVAGIIGREGFGILSWARKGPRIPLSFMDAIMKVTFPTFSRVQDDLPLLKRFISRSIYCISLVVFPILAGISLVAADFIFIIPKYIKWLPAIVPLYFIAASYAIAAVTTPLTNAFNAVGKIAITTKLMIMWTLLTWIFYPILSLKYGYIGASIAALLVGLSSFIVWYLAKKHFNVNVVSEIKKPILGTLLIILQGLLINSLGLSIYHQLIFKIIVGSFIYILYLYIFNLQEILWFYHQLKNLRSKK